MGTYVTNTGFQKKTLIELKTELEAEFQATFGSNIDLDPSGPIGQLIGLLAARDANLWDGMGEIYTSRSPNQATGVSLDEIAAQTGIIRIDAQPTTVENVILYGSEGVVVATGKQVKQASGNLNYSLDSGVTITKTAARELQLDSFDDPSGGGVIYTVTINSIPYTYTSSGGDTVADVIDDLVSSITGGAWAGTAFNINDDTLKLLDVDADFNVSWTATMSLALLGSGGSFTCDEDGANTLPANTLDTIVTPVTNWDSVNNPEVGTTGVNTETDAELRLRRATSFFSGNATDEAIRSGLVNNVTGVTSVSVVSNREYETNSNKIVFDADFVTGNNIDVNLNGTDITTVPFNSDHDTTMDDLVAQIEADVSDCTAVIDSVDSDNRSIIVTISTLTILYPDQAIISVSGGASQASAAIYFCDGEGKPAKSFEAIVEGGASADIAEEIWARMPSGIKSYGSNSETIQDSEGNDQVIYYSRPETVYVWITVKRGYNTEEEYPTDGDDQIKANIVEWALTNLDPGIDLIRQRLSTPIYEVSGIGDIEITLDYSINIAHTPSYSEKNVEVTVRQLADVAVSRITVSDLP